MSKILTFPGSVYKFIWFIVLSFRKVSNASFSSISHLLLNKVSSENPHKDSIAMLTNVYIALQLIYKLKNLKKYQKIRKKYRLIDVFRIVQYNIFTIHINDNITLYYSLLIIIFKKKVHNLTNLTICDVVLQVVS